MTAPSWERIQELRRARPRSRLVRGSAVALLVATAFAWFGGWIDWAGILSPVRRANLARFWNEDMRPAPLRAGGDWSEVLPWLGDVLSTRGIEALLVTFWISVAAIVSAAAVAWIAAPFAARTLWQRDPFLRAPSGAIRHVATGTRFALVLLRAIPEYIWAFLLLAILGPSPWPLILALAIHNAGILGRLSAESLENVETGAPRALATLGASRMQIAWTALRSGAFGRLVLFVLYRYETCVREATVLGLLGVVSLGYWIQDARARQNYDEMIVLIACGGALVLAGDLGSYLARRWLRQG